MDVPRKLTVNAPARHKLYEFIGIDPAFQAWFEDHKKWGKTASLLFPPSLIRTLGEPLSLPGQNIAYIYITRK